MKLVAGVLLLASGTSEGDDAEDIGAQLQGINKVYENGKFRDAAVQATKLASKGVADLRTLLGIAFIQRAGGMLEEAEATLNLALSLAPKNARAYADLGIVLSDSGKEKRAINALRRAVELDPKYADAWYNLAVCYATSSPPDLPAGRAAYKRACELGGETEPSLERLLYPPP